LLHPAIELELMVEEDPTSIIDFPLEYSSKNLAESLRYWVGSTSEESEALSGTSAGAGGSCDEEESVRRDRSRDDIVYLLIFVSTSMLGA